VRKTRGRYVAAHRAVFSSANTSIEYLRDWVANFEISDFFQQQHQRRHRGLAQQRGPSALGGTDCTSPDDGDDGGDDDNDDDDDRHDPLARTAMDGVVFLRFNQSSELPSAKHEERERMVAEEMCFASAGRGECDKGANFGPGDTVFLAEVFAPERALLTPEAYVSRVQRGQLPRPTVFVLDLNGHFCVAVPALLRDRSQAKTKKKQTTKQLVLFNTSIGNYLTGSGGLVSAMALDLAFPPSQHAVSLEEGQVPPEHSGSSRSSAGSPGGGSGGVLAGERVERHESTLCHRRTDSVDSDIGDGAGGAANT
jgi:hypothetical protein